jgi:hypothetical protein
LKMPWSRRLGSFLPRRKRSRVTDDALALDDAALAYCATCSMDPSIDAEALAEIASTLDIVDELECLALVSELVADNRWIQHGKVWEVPPERITEWAQRQPGMSLR